jgi:hypothetical protein
MAREITPVVVLHVPKTIHKSQTVEVSRDHGFGRMEIEHVSVEEWKNSSNTALYLDRLSEGGGAIELTVSEVLLNPKSVVTPQRPYA